MFSDIYTFSLYVWCIYSWTKISEIVGISRTLYRGLREGGIDTDDYTTLTSSELDNKIKEIKHDFPNDGEVMMKSHWESKFHTKHYVILFAESIMKTQLLVNLKS